MAYDAFISYSHGADLDLAPVVRDALQRLAKPWHKRRALSVFLDQASLELSAELGGSLDERIQDTRWLVLFMSEQSAQSRWVGEEISEWTAKKSKEQLALVLTSGEVVWDDDAKDFDYERSTAVSEGMRGVYTGQDSEPLFLDLCWTKELADGEKSLDLTNLKFRDAIATLAAPIHGIPKDELEGEDVRQFRLARRLRRAAISGLAVLFVLAVAAAVVARIQSNFSEARRLAAVSEANAAEQTDIAHLLALESLLVRETEEGWAALFKSLSQPILALSPMAGHADTVNDVAFSPHAPLMASASSDQTVRLWNLETGLQDGEALTGHEVAVLALAFGPDGGLLASASGGTIRLWDLNAAPRVQKAAMTSTEDVVQDLAFSPVGPLLASGGWDGSLRLWDVNLKKVLWQRPGSDGSGWVVKVAFSSGGTRLASASRDGAVRIWGLDGELLAEPLNGQSGWDKAMAFTLDLTHFAAADGDNSIRVWDLASGLETSEPLTGHRDKVRSLGFGVDPEAPDRLRLASTSLDRTIRLWDVTSGRSIGEPLTGHDGPVCAVAFSADGSRLLSGSFDTAVRLWDLAAGHRVGATLTGHTKLRSVAISPDGRFVATGGRDRKARLWDVASGRQIGEPMDHGGTVRSLAFGPNGSLLATGSDDGTARLWSVTADGQGTEPLKTLSAPQRVRAMAFDAEGSRLATAGFKDGALRVFEVESGEMRGELLNAHDGVVQSVAFSRDGELLASVDSDGVVRSWRVGPGIEPLRTLTDQKSRIWALAFSADDSRLIAAGEDGIRWWGVEESRSGGSLPADRTRGLWIQTASFSSDGALLATTTRDGTLLVWDTSSGRPLGEPLRGHRETVVAMAFSHDPILLASVSNDATLRLWPAQSDWPVLACGATTIGRNLALTGWQRSDLDPDDYRRPCPSESYRKMDMGWPARSGNWIEAITDPRN